MGAERMSWIRTLKLSHQILILLLSIPVFLAVSLLYYSANQQVRIRNKPLEQLALSTSSAIAEKVDRNLNERFSDIQAFAFNPMAARAIENNQADSTLQAFMNRMMVYYKWYDLMMLCDLSGKVILVNTKDPANNPVGSRLLLGKNMSDQEWFRSSIVVGGPIGGAYFSDFNTDDNITLILGTSGYGIDFSAPVKNESGKIVGVWRNRVSWKEVTHQIRKESETTLRKEVPGSLVLLMDKQGHLIDADVESNILKVTIGKNNLFKHFDFEYAGIAINEDEFLYGWAESSGSKSYYGNKWKYLTLIPKVTSANLDLYLQSDWTKLMLFSVSVLVLGIILSLLFVRNFSKRIVGLKYSIQRISEGEINLPENNNQQDEIGEMSYALHTLSQNFTKMAQFSAEIGAGNFTTSFAPLGEKDVLGISLLKMKRNLELNQNNIAQQKWVSDTLSSLGEILREQNTPGAIYRKALSSLAKSIQAHQAALYIIKSDHILPEIHLVAGYALNEARLNSKPFLLGENQVGQCIKDNEAITLYNLPEDYADKINSGLGEYSPVELHLAPIRFNNQAIGALEFSFLKNSNPFLLQLIEKASDYFGSYHAQILLNNQKDASRMGDQNSTDPFYTIN